MTNFFFISGLTMFALLLAASGIDVSNPTVTYGPGLTMAPGYINYSDGFIDWCVCHVTSPTRSSRRSSLTRLCTQCSGEALGSLGRGATCNNARPRCQHLPHMAKRDQTLHGDWPDGLTGCSTGMSAWCTTASSLLP